MVKREKIYIEKNIKYLYINSVSQFCFSIS